MNAIIATIFSKYPGLLRTLSAVALVGAQLAPLVPPLSPYADLLNRLAAFLATVGVSRALVRAAI